MELLLRASGGLGETPETGSKLPESALAGLSSEERDHIEKVSSIMMAFFEISATNFCDLFLWTYFIHFYSCSKHVGVPTLVAVQASLGRVSLYRQLC